MKERENSSTASRPKTGSCIFQILPRLAVAFAIGMALLLTPVIPAVAAPPIFGIGVTVSFGPPPLPYYAQPLCPGPGYIWTPGYWAWSPDYGYYWVPGTWVEAPFVGALWTPGYWGWDVDGDDYVWYPGYWGTQVGFYGGIDYGYGYNGYGYEGGHWQDHHFYYNRDANNVGNVPYYYNRSFRRRDSRVSFNGGRDGVQARANERQKIAARDRRRGEIQQQIRQRDAARRRPPERASVNHGRPEIAATRTPGHFNHNTVRASRAGGRFAAHPAGRASQQRGNPARGNWRQFGNSPQRMNHPSRAYRPQRQHQPHAFRPQRQRPRAFRPQRTQAPRYARQAPRQQRPQMRQQSPPRHYQAHAAPRGYRSAPHGHASADRGHGRGNPHGRRH